MLIHGLMSPKKSKFFKNIIIEYVFDFVFPISKNAKKPKMDTQRHFSKLLEEIL